MECRATRVRPGPQFAAATSRAGKKGRLAVKPGGQGTAREIRLRGYPEAAGEGVGSEEADAEGDDLLPDGALRVVNRGGVTGILREDRAPEVGEAGAQGVAESTVRAGAGRALGVVVEAQGPVCEHDA